MDFLMLIIQIGLAVVKSLVEFDSLSSGPEELHDRFDRSKALKGQIRLVPFERFQRIITAGDGHSNGPGLFTMNDVPWGIPDNEDSLDLAVSTIMSALDSNASQLGPVL